MDTQDKPLQFSLRMMFLIVAILAYLMAWIVTIGRYGNSMNNVWLLQNGPIIKEVRAEQEKYKRNNGGRTDPDLERLIQRLERGEQVDW
jgi:hypothetical protein